MMKEVLFAFTVIISISCIVAPPTPPPPPATIPPTHYLLIIQWPRSFCRSVPQTGLGACDKDYEKLLHNKFTIHGLWPQKKPSCQQPLFDDKGFIHLPGLTEKWPNVTSLNTDVSGIGDQSFWEHEWNKHGRCQPTLKQNPYFQFVLDTFDRTLMIREEIEKTYHGKPSVITGQIIQAIETKFKIKVDMKCKVDLRVNKPTHKLLHEVYFNVSLTGVIQNMTTRYTACPSTGVKFE